MRSGEVGKENIAWANVLAYDNVDTSNWAPLAEYIVWLTMTLTGCNHVAVLDKDTLGCSCGSGGVHDAGKIIGLGREWVSWVRLSKLHQFLVAHDL
jgi:hypothetical protein